MRKANRLYYSKLQVHIINILVTSLEALYDFKMFLMKSLMLTKCALL